MAAKSRRKRKSPKPLKTQTLTAGTVITFEEPSSERKPKPSAAKVIVHEINPVSGFFDFLKEHAVIGLIIGFVIGAQVQALVKVLVDNFINPFTQLLFGTKLSERSFELHFHTHSAKFGWGALAVAIIIFLFVLIIMYLIIKVLNLDELEKQEEKS